MIEPDRYWRIGRLLLSEGKEVPLPYGRYLRNLRTMYTGPRTHAPPQETSPRWSSPKRTRTARSRPARVFLVAASSRSTFLPPSSLSPPVLAPYRRAPIRPIIPIYPSPPAFSTSQGSHLKGKRWQVTKVTTEVTEGQPHVRLSKHKTHSDHLVGWLAGGLTDCFVRQAALA